MDVTRSCQPQLGFEHLIHPTIEKSSYKQYCNGHFRDAALNAVVAIFDYIRSLTGIDADGDALVNKAFSLENSRKAAIFGRVRILIIQNRGNLRCNKIVSDRVLH